MSSDWQKVKEIFNSALERDPGSGRALFGLMQAEQGAGKAAEARATYAKFARAWAKADSDLPEMQRAKVVAAETRTK